MKIRCINTHQAPGAAAGVSACSSPSAIHAGRGEQPRWRMAAGTGPLLPSLTSLLSEGVPGCGFSLRKRERGAWVKTTPIRPALCGETARRPCGKSVRVAGSPLPWSEEH